MVLCGSCATDMRTAMTLALAASAMGVTFNFETATSPGWTSGDSAAGLLPFTRHSGPATSQQTGPSAPQRGTASPYYA